MDDNHMEKLIEEHEKEEKYFENVILNMIESDELDRLIADRFEYIDDHFDFDPSPEYEQLEEIYLQQYDSMESAYNGNGFQEYIPNDDPFDTLDGCDYPEGPTENIEGINYPEFYVDDHYDIDEPDIPELDSYEFEEPEFVEPDYAKLYEELIADAEIEKYEDDLNIEYLIENHIKDEKAFLDSILIDVIQEQSYFEKAIDELIFEHIEEEYSPQNFDYEPDYWYDDSFDDYSGEVWPEDESVIDPFDSFDEIDYPEGEPKFDYSLPEEYYYQEELEEDFQRYVESQERKREKKFETSNITEPEEEINETLRNKNLIEENEKFERILKDYLINDDNLDKIIKEKLKEKKFN